MDIRPDPSALDRLARQRQAERRLAEGAGPGSPGRSEAGGSEQPEVVLDSAAAERFVKILSHMDPVDLHRVEDLRQRISAGDYQASADELVDPLLDILSQDGDREA